MSDISHLYPMRAILLERAAADRLRAINEELVDALEEAQFELFQFGVTLRSVNAALAKAKP
jgi:hypothetical protein